MNEAISIAEEPAAPGPNEIGAQMAALRQQFNLSQQEVSERLHIRPRYVNAIEEGRYELMPGKVYARGYVHTYAEFLGLDADKIVAQCFAGEAPANAQPIPPIAAARYASPTARVGLSPSVSSSMSSTSGKWRGYAVIGAILLVMMLIVAQFTSHDGEPEKQETSVSPVPEAMLASVRNMTMPLPDSYLCLTTDSALECFNTDATSRMIGRLNVESLYYGGPLDLAAIAAVVDKKSADEPAEEDPDSPPVATEPEFPPVTEMDDEQKNEPGPPHD